MKNGLEGLANMEYPGRFIIMGRTDDGSHNVVVYGLTGRSDSSKARKLPPMDGFGVIGIEVTDMAQLQQGSPALLVYPAICTYDRSKVVSHDIDDYIFVSNGVQTNLIYSTIQSLGQRTSPWIVLGNAMEKPVYMHDKKFGWIDITSYEPDEPNYTPRIGGCSLADYFALQISRRNEHGNCEKSRFGFDAKKGLARLISTYTGENKKPLPSFVSLPLHVVIQGKTPAEVAMAVWDSLAPKKKNPKPEDDYRVSVAAIFSNITDNKVVGEYIKNLHEKPEVK